MARRRTVRGSRVGDVCSLENLESRLLLSSTATVYDWDGDKVEVSLVGQGSVAVVQPILQAGNPGILYINLNDTEGCDSVLNIKVTKMGGGNGLVDIGRITGGTTENIGIHALNAPAANIVGTATANPLDADGDGSGYGIDMHGFLRQTVIHDLRANVFAKQFAAGSVPIWYPDCTAANFTANDIAENVSIIMGSRLEKFTAHSWGLGGSLNVKKFDAINITGDFGADITVQRTSGTVTIGGAVKAEAARTTLWTFPGDIGAIKVGSSQTYWSTTVTGAAKSLASTAGEMVFTTFQAGSLGTVTTKAGMNGALTLNPTNQNVAQVLTSATIGGALNGTWTINRGTGAIKADSVNGWAATVTGGAVASLKVTKDMTFKSFSAVALGALTVGGNMNVALGGTGLMTLTQPPTASNVYALGKTSVGKVINGVTIRATGNIQSVQATGLIGAKLFAGVKASVTTSPGVSTASSWFDQESRIGAVTITGIKPRDPFDPHSIRGSSIFAASLGNLNLTGASEWSPNVIGTRHIDSLKHTKPDGTKATWVTPSPVTNPTLWPDENQIAVWIVS